MNAILFTFIFDKHNVYVHVHLFKRCIRLCCINGVNTLAALLNVFSSYDCLYLDLINVGFYINNISNKLPLRDGVSLHLVSSSLYSPT